MKSAPVKGALGIAATVVRLAGRDHIAASFATPQANPPPPCAVSGCKRPGIEAHHTAPKALFGRTAGDWPIVPLCRAHHTEWHARVTPELHRLRNVAIRARRVAA